MHPPHEARLLPRVLSCRKHAPWSLSARCGRGQVHQASQQVIPHQGPGQDASRQGMSLHGRQGRGHTCHPGGHAEVLGSQALGGPPFGGYIGLHSSPPLPDHLVLAPCLQRAAPCRLCMSQPVDMVCCAWVQPDGRPTGEVLANARWTARPSCSGVKAAGASIGWHLPGTSMVAAGGNGQALQPGSSSSGTFASSEAITSFSGPFWSTAHSLCLQRLSQMNGCCGWLSRDSGCTAEPLRHPSEATADRLLSSSPAELCSTPAE